MLKATLYLVAQHIQSDEPERIIHRDTFQETSITRLINVLSSEMFKSFSRATIARAIANASLKARGQKTNETKLSFRVIIDEE